MKNIIVLILFLSMLGCDKKNEKSKENNLIHIKEILYKDKINNYYFQYYIPERRTISGEDVGYTKFGYDSTVNLNNRIVNLKTIINSKSFHKIKDKYEDKNYYYYENEYLW